MVSMVTAMITERKYKMEFYDVVNSRHSIRKYNDTPVPRETVNKILKAGIQAPSWNNRQCWRYILISDQKVKEALSTLFSNPMEECFKRAPYILVLCADPSDSGHQGGKDYYLVDCGISMEHVVLAAAAEGLGTCWIGVFPENPVRKLLNVPEGIRVVAMTPLGFPDENPERSERKEFDKIVFEEQWSYL